MKNLFFTVFAVLLFLTSSNAGAAAMSPEMSCTFRIYDSETGETLGYAVAIDVSCCNCASTKARVLAAWQS